MASQRRGGISWTDETWNCLRGCSRISPGCKNCYAELVAARFSGPGQAFEGLARMTPSGPRWTGEVRVIDEHLQDPLRWKKPRRIFVNSVSDLFHERVAFRTIDDIFAVMALAPQHTFQCLTKRAGIMRERLSHPHRGVEISQRAFEIARDRGGPIRDARDWPSMPWPLPNVWLGVSVEGPEQLSRVAELRETPAAVRFLSLEPLLDDMGPLDLRGIHWVIVGGESGPGARSMELGWATRIVEQCRASSVPVFVKQIGARPRFLDAVLPVDDPKGGDPAEWPESLRVREFPVIHNPSTL